MPKYQFLFAAGLANLLVLAGCDDRTKEKRESGGGPATQAQAQDPDPYEKELAAKLQNGIAVEDPLLPKDASERLVRLELTVIGLHHLRAGRPLLPEEEEELRRVTEEIATIKQKLRTAQGEDKE